MTTDDSTRPAHSPAHGTAHGTGHGPGHGPAPTDTLRTVTAGDGWTFLDGLQDAHPGTVPLAGDAPHHRADRAIPAVKKLGALDGVTVVRLAFRAGDVMADHSAAAPVLILGQVGEVTVTVAGEDGTGDGTGDGTADSTADVTVTLAPGQALNIAAGRVHSLRADAPATVTLLVLTGH